MNTDSIQTSACPPVPPAAGAAPPATGKVNPKPAVEPPPAELYWLAPGAAWNETAAPIRQAVRNLILPAYRTLVADCPDPIERAAGMSLVHLMWLEICQQHKLGETVSAPASVLAVVANPADQIARHLSLLSAKQQVTDLLFKSRIARKLIDKAKQSPPATPSFPPGAELWTMFPMPEPNETADNGGDAKETTNHTDDTNRADSLRRKTTDHTDGHGYRRRRKGNTD